MSESEATILALTIVGALLIFWFIWKLFGPSRSAGYFQEDPYDYHEPNEPTVAAEAAPEQDSPDEILSHEAVESQLSHPQDYVDAGIYAVTDAKKLIRRLEARGVDFYLEAPHVDPAQGDVFDAAYGGSYGLVPQTIIFVHQDHLDAFDAAQNEMHQHETEVSDETSLLEAFRSFGVNHDLDSTVEEREGRNRSESDSQQ